MESPPNPSPSLHAAWRGAADAARAHARRGAAAVELAVLLPFLMFMLLAAGDFARVFYFAVVVDNCAGAGALYAARGPVQAQDQAGVTQAVTDDSAGLTAEGLTLNWPPQYFQDANGNRYVTVTCTYTFRTCTGFPGIPTTAKLSRSVSARIAQ